MAGKYRRHTGQKGNIKRSNKYGIIGITFVMAAFAVVIGTRIRVSDNRIKDLDRQIDELEASYREQEKRGLELQERKAYVQTKKYVEEVAKQLGLVYPDEIIYKPSN